MDLDRFAPDAPDDDAPGEGRACVVATQPATFERCRDGFYPAPRSYDRTRADFDYLAFYRTAPVSAITHYARVRDRTEQVRGDPGPMAADDWEALIDGHGVRGAWYCTIEDLRRSGTLSALSERAETP